METGELKRIVHEIESQNYAVITFTLSYKELKEAADAFLDFCELPSEVKSKLAAPFVFEPRGTIGYGKRDKSMGAHDTKEVFQYHEALLEAIPELKTSKDPIIRKFIDSTHKVYEHAKSTCKELLSYLSIEEPEIVNKFFKGDSGRFYLRLLKYDEVPIGGTVGAGHYDRGGFALALAESAPGLRIWHKENPQEVHHKDGYALFLPGITFNDATTKLKLPKTWHDVVQKTPPLRPGVSRWAIAFFADPLEQREVTAEEARTRDY